MVDVLNRLDIAAAVPGDHDFEWSVDTLRRRMSEARYPWVAANVFDAGTGKRPDWISALPDAAGRGDEHRCRGLHYSRNQSQRESRS